MKQRVKNFFFPPSGAPLWLKILPYAVLGFATMFLLVGGAYAWDYTNSPPFCGETCHTMPPEYTSYLTSPHARINCTECHIGRSYLATQVTRKAGDLQHVTKTLFHDYEFPITADDMRPARESCERCHFPEKFSDDSLRVIRSFTSDKFNTPNDTYLVLKTGGGSKRQGLGKGIHWHIENPIYYYPTDKEEQDIPYVRIVNEDGTTQEYVDVESGFDPASVDPSQLKEMDCITCHNRITHLVLQPEQSVDKAIANGLIDASLPEFRRQAVEILRAPYNTTQEAVIRIGSIEEFYKTYYPDIYTEKQSEIQTSIQTVQEIYTASVYPEQKSDWNTHPNNIGHKFSPGCFRCHDGKHLNADQEAIRLECNLCHSIPRLSGPTNFVTDIEISTGPEPESHQNPNWMALHRDAFDTTCSNCHDTSDPGGTSNTSFCSNSICHGSVWTYVGFDAPALRQALQGQLPEPAPAVEIPAEEPLTYNDTIGPLLQARCAACHGGEAPVVGLDLTSYATAMKGSANGLVILPGEAQNSPLVIKQSSEQPHFTQLNPDELQLLVDWIQSGAPE
jgi:nitrate/TMAO reductase-like tetraheme cytochrome c subunit